MPANSSMRQEHSALQDPTQPHGIKGVLKSSKFRKHALKVTLYIGLWYTFSGLLSVYNKWLFGKSERDFGFPLFVSSAHMAVQYTLAYLTLRFVPSLRPRSAPSVRDYVTRAVPCGVASALDVGLSNMSLRTITLTFYTMCKSSSLGFVVLFAFAFGLERVRLSLMFVVLVISMGVILMVFGEIKFEMWGFIEAITAAAMGGLRWSLTQILVSRARFGMNNPVATMEKLTPIIGTSMLAFSLAVEHPISELPKNTNFSSLRSGMFMVALMAAGGVLAFLMVLSEYCLIAQTSVVTLSIAGMAKEVLMVGVAHFVFGDEMTLINGCGMVVALAGIGLYNWLKMSETVTKDEPEFVIEPYAELPALDPELDDGFEMTERGGESALSIDIDAVLDDEMAERNEAETLRQVA